MKFELMKREQLPQILTLEQLCFAASWKMEDLVREWDENPFSKGWVVRDNQELVGYAFVWEMYEDSQLARIGIHPKCRKRHIGHSFLQRLMDQVQKDGCTSMSLDVRVGNKAGIGLYRKCGFAPVHTSKGYYADGEDAWVMQKVFKEVL